MGKLAESNLLYRLEKKNQLNNAETEDRLIRRLFKQVKFDDKNIIKEKKGREQILTI